MDVTTPRPLHFGPLYFMVCFDGEQRELLTNQDEACSIAYGLKMEDPRRHVSVVIVPTEVVTETLEGGGVQKTVYCLPHLDDDEPLAVETIAADAVELTA